MAFVDGAFVGCRGLGQGWLGTASATRYRVNRAQRLALPLDARRVRVRARTRARARVRVRVEWVARERRDSWKERPEEEEDQLPGGTVARWALGSDIPLPLNTSVKSGYLLAATAVMFAGGGTITIAFVPFLAVGLALDASPALAAGAAGLTALLVDLLRLNVLSAVSSVTGAGSAGSGGGSPLVPLLFFAAIVGATIGVSDGAEGVEAGAVGGGEAGAVGGGESGAVGGGDMYRKRMLERVRQRQGVGRGSGEEEEEDGVGGATSQDFLEWDKKFQRQDSTELDGGGR